MSAVRFVVLWLSLGFGFLTIIPLSHAQTLPLQGPGLGNLTYTDAELFRSVSIIKWNTNTGIFTSGGVFIANGTTVQSTDPNFAAVKFIKDNGGANSGIEDAPNGALKVVSGSYTNGMPAFHAPANQNPVRAYGINVSVMVNGYLLTAFAPDGGYPTGGWLLYDVSNPRDIKLKKTVYDPSGTTKDFREPHSLGVTTIAGKTYVVMAADTGVEFWDFTDINDIKRVKKLTLGQGYPNNFDYDALSWQLFWQAPYLYVASSGRGLHIIDARDPANAKLADRGSGKPNPVPIGSLGGFRLGPIFAMGNQLLLSSMETTAGFASLDISDPLNPVLVNSKATLPTYYATCYNGKKLYTSGRNAAGKVGGYDLTDVRNITTENENASPVEGLYCATQDNILIVGAQRHIFKYDVSNPASYPELGRSERVANPTFVPPLAKTDPDLGQVTMYGNLVFVGGDHGHDTAFRPHQKLPDTTRPVVIATSPANGAQQQSVTSRVGFGLSDNILLETLNTTNFIVRVKGGAQVAGLYSVQLGMINFAPIAPLQPDTEYEAVLKANGLKDYAGNAIAQDYTLTFRTGNPAATAAANRWPLSDSLSDVIGANNGTASAADVYSQGGLDFTNRTTGVQLANDTIADALGGSATVSFRIKTSQVGNNAPWLAPGIFGRDQAGGGSDVFWGWIDASGYLNLSVANATASNPGTRSSARINDGLWHEVAMTRNADTGAQTVTVDGVKTSSNSSAGVLGLSNKLQMLGQIQGNSVAFKGILADVRVYKRVLNDAQVKAIFRPDTLVLPQQQVGTSVTIDPAQLGLSGVQYIWNFGDGSPPVITTSASPIASHTYANPGNYTISVTVVDANGAETPYAFIQTVIIQTTPNPPVHTSNIVGNGTTVYALDPDAGTVAAIDAANLQKLWQVAVGKEPKTLAISPDGQLWVAVQGDDKLVKINPTTRNLTSFNLDYGSAPYGVAFTPDGNKGLLTLAGESALVEFNPFTGLIGRRVTLPGGDTRGIAVSADSTTAYVTRFRSQMTQGELYKVNLGTMAATTIALPVDTTTVATEAAAPGVANYVNQVVISPDGRRAILPSKKDNIVNGRFRNAIDLKQDTTVRSIVSQVNLTNGSHVFAEQIDFNNRAPARAAVFSPPGNYIFAAQMESNSIEVVDTYRRTVIASLSGARRTPHGLYLDAAGKRLFVNNFLDRSVSVHDISKVLLGVDFITPPPTIVPTVTTEPLTANVLAGKKVFYNAADPRMSREMYISCASCHVDGDSDGMVWDFTQRGEGLRRTISLQGRQGTGSATGKLHWTANFDELQDFEKDIRDEFGGAGFMSATNYQNTINPLGPKKAGLSADLDNLAAYVSSLSTFPRSPYRDAQGCLTATALQGRTTFQAGTCTTCHGNAVVQDNARHDVGTIQPSSGKGSNLALAGVGFDTPTLYNLWGSSSFFHNGQARTLTDVFTAASQTGGANFSQQHGGSVSAAQVSGLVSYLQSLDGTPACSGQ